MVSRTQIAKNRVGAFTFDDTNICKGIAVLMMMFHHLFNDYEEYAGCSVDYLPFTGDQITTIALMCKVCVAVFVFITGFGLAASYAKQFGHDRESSARELAAFSVRRWWKLMTNFWPIYVFALLCGPLGRSAFSVYAGGARVFAVDAVVDFLGLSEAFGTPTLNPTWWYMSLAVLLIFIAPFAMHAVKSFGSFPVFASCLIGLGLFGTGTDILSLYLSSFLLGILCHELNVLEIWDGKGLDSTARTCLKACLSGVTFFALVLIRNLVNPLGIVDAFAAMLLCMFVMSCVRFIPVLSGLFGVFGRHSSNIFFTHTLLYSYYFLGFYYGFRYPVLILVVLAATTLALSVVIEILKKRTGYLGIMQKAGEHVVSALTK